MMKVLDNIVAHDHLNQNLVDYGIWIYLLKIVLKTELHPRLYRKEALRLFITIAKHLGSKSYTSQTLEFLYPANTRKVYFTSNLYSIKF